jgi:hypothetical protein
LPGVEERDNQQIKAVRATLNGKKKKVFVCAKYLTTGQKETGHFCSFLFCSFQWILFSQESASSRDYATHTHTQAALFLLLGLSQHYYQPT